MLCNINFSDNFEISSAIKKLQRVKSIVVPRVGAGGFPLFSGYSFTFKMIEAIAFYNCPGAFMWNAENACKKSVYKKEDV